MMGVRHIGAPLRLVLALQLGVVLGCAPKAAVAPITPPVPTRFEGVQQGGPSIGRLPWRSYFDDPRLIALIDEALEHNLDLAIAMQRIEQTRAGVTLATGAVLPRVDATIGAGVRKFGRYTMDGAGNASTNVAPGRQMPTHLGDFGLGVQASWEADVWGKMRNRRKAAKAYVIASQEEAHLVRTMLVADVATYWYELQAVDHVRDVVDSSISSQEHALEVVRIQREAGRASPLAIQQFQAQLAETRALDVDLVRQARSLEVALNVVLGRFPEPIERAAPLTFEPNPAVAHGLPSDLLHLRPDVRQAEAEVAAAKLEVKAARAEFFPRLTLSGSIGLQAFNPAYLFVLPESLAYSVAGGIVAPLINRKGIRAQFEWADAAQLEAAYNYQKVVLSAFAEATTSLADLGTIEEIVALEQAKKAAVEGAVTTADTLYRAGKATYLELLLTQQAVLGAELALIDAWRRQRLASVTVYKALGGGWQ
jgi:NodT family efflux transporter outer membrane factor (OMF) lipoprotein